jgi:hypothetical protein
MLRIERFERPNTETSSSVYSSVAAPGLFPIRPRHPAARRLKPVPLPSERPVGEEKSDWLEICLRDKEGNPVPFVQVEILFHSGARYVRRTNESGVVRIDNVSDKGGYRARLMRRAA